MNDIIVTKIIFTIANFLLRISSCTCNAINGGLNFDQCFILLFLLTEELEKAKMQSYRSVEQLEALSGKYINKERF